MTRSLLGDLTEVSRRIDQASRIAVCIDFDGTLAPLVDHPAHARLAPRMEQALWELAGSSKVILTIISGRERGDLQARIGIPNIYYAGNHGLEISGDGVLFIEPAAAERCASLRDLAATLAERLRPIEGILVEDKGLTVTIHYRLVAEPLLEEVRRVVHATLAASSHPFLLGNAEKAYEIRPRVYWNKGTAVRWLLQLLKCEDALVIYLGDDVSDEEAFAALADGITVRIGVPAETAAHHHLEDPSHVEEFLIWLANHLMVEQAIQDLSASVATGRSA